MKKYNALLLNGLLDKTNHQNAVGEQIHFNGELFYKISKATKLFLRRSIMILKYRLAMSGQHQKSLDLLDQLNLKT